MSENKARELNARLYIEGRSVPFQGISTTHTVGQPGVATIQVPPLPEIRRIKPRTMVHVFIKDFTAPKGTKPWVLLFEGEIYGYSQGKSTRGRSFNIYAMDFTNYWDNARQFYMNLRTSFGEPIAALKSVQTTALVNEQGARTTTIRGTVKSYLAKLLNDAIAGSTTQDAFLEGIVSIIKKVEEVNAFFRYNQARYRINDRILFRSSQNLAELFDFINKDNFWEAITGQGNGGFRTVRQIINKLMGMIFHDFVSIPAPSKVTKVGISSGIGDGDKQVIGSFIFKPDTFMLPPPKCNVIYPDLYGSIQFNRNFFHEVTRFKVAPIQSTAEQQQNFFGTTGKTYYTPTGFNKFRNGTENPTNNSFVTGPQFEPEVNQGFVNDEIADSEVTTSAQDFNYMSREEILKGIFPDFGTPIPSAQILMSITKEEQQDKFFQQATDYLFFKKRLASRSAQANGPLNLAPVPGFPCLFLDDSTAEQNVVGVLQSISHNVDTQSGASTSYTVAFARDVDEEDLWDNAEVNEPPIPTWYDEAVFGKYRDLQESDYINLPESQRDKVRRFRKVTGFENTTIASYYEGFFGKSEANQYLGSQPIISNKFPNIYAATLAILESYRTAKRKKEEKEFVRVQTRRDYVLLDENFRFLGADIKPSQKRVNFLDKQDIIFTGEVFDGGYVDKATKETSKDEELRNAFGPEAAKKRREPIDAYRKRLFKERGFRG